MAEKDTEEVSFTDEESSGSTDDVQSAYIEPPRDRQKQIPSCYHQYEWAPRPGRPDLYGLLHKVWLHVRNHPVRGATSIYGVTLEDIKAICGVSTDELRRAMREGELDPQDLQSICIYWYSCMRREVVSQYDVTVGSRRRRIDLHFEPQKGDTDGSDTW